MVMTFDEVVEIIWGNILGIDASDEPGKKDFIIKDDMVATGREGLTFLIMELKDTYAPTIEMTHYEKQVFDSWLKEDDFDTPFSGFLHHLGELGGYEDRGLFLDLSEKDLMQAWLHPETIKVVD
jgi:hypothetical protein